MNFLRRVHWLVIVGVVGIALVFGLIVMGGESPQTKAAQFMSALATANVDKLADTSYVKGVSPEEMKEQWAKCIGLSKYYTFQWRVASIVPQSADQVGIRLQIVRNAAVPGSYEEPYDIMVKKVDGRWYVDPTSLSREAFPFLPRF